MTLISILKKRQQPREETRYHFILIEAPLHAVGPEIILWGEAAWWPKKSKLQFARINPGDIQTGTRYQARLLAFRAPLWEVEVTNLVDDQEIQRTFSHRRFKIKENLNLEERYNGTKVNYWLTYNIQGLFHRILWRVLFQRFYNQSVMMALASLKDYIESQQRV
jgi:hypothetical protein